MEKDGMSNEIAYQFIVGKHTTKCDKLKIKLTALKDSINLT
jgi:hypothetical protein